MADLGLNEHHEDIIINYMRFARYQRIQNLKAVEYSFKDIIDSRLLEDTYTSEEVREILTGLCKVVQTDVESELINTSHSNVLLLKELFKQAEKWHLRLQADFSQLENKELLENIKKLEHQEFLGSLHDKAPPSPSKVKLRPLDEAVGSLSLLNKEIERLNEENKRLKVALTSEEEKVSKIQNELEQVKNQFAAISQEAQELQAKSENAPQISQLNEVEDQLAETKELLIADKEQASAERQHLQDKLETAKQRFTAVQAQLQLAEQELERKFSETVAYANMKKMLAKKNELIKSLRTKLQDTQDIDKDSLDD